MFDGEEFDVHLLEQFLDTLGAHHGDELAGELGIELPFPFVGDDFGLVQAGALAGIHDDKRLEVQHALEVAQGNVEQVADAARQTFEEPDVRARAGQFNVAQPLAADARQRDFDAALVADDATVLHAFVLAA